MDNDFIMGQTQYEVELVLRDTAERPTRASYSGYDKFAGQLFCYSSMNMSEFVEYHLQQRPEDNVSSDADPLPLP
jgi:hypothetical protein